MRFWNNFHQERSKSKDWGETCFYAYRTIMSNVDKTYMY